MAGQGGINSPVSSAAPALGGGSQTAAPQPQAQPPMQQGGIGSLLGQQGGMGFGGGAPMPGSNAPSFSQLATQQGGMGGQGGMGAFGGGAPMPGSNAPSISQLVNQQQPPAGANFGVSSYGPGLDQQQLAAKLGGQGGLLQPLNAVGGTSFQQAPAMQQSPFQADIMRLQGQGMSYGDAQRAAAANLGLSAEQTNMLERGMARMGDAGLTADQMRGLGMQQMSPANQANLQAMNAAMQTQALNAQGGGMSYQQALQQAQPSQIANLGGMTAQQLQQQAMQQQYTPEQQQLAYQAAQQHATQFANPQATQGRFGAMPSPTQANLGQMGRGMQEQAKLQQLGARGNLAQQTLQNAPGQMNSPFRALSQGRVV